MNKDISRQPEEQSTVSEDSDKNGSKDENIKTTRRRFVKRLAKSSAVPIVAPVVLGVSNSALA